MQYKINCKETNMKRLVLLATLLLFVTICFSQQSFYYKMSATAIANNGVQKIYIAYEIAGTKQIDSFNIQTTTSLFTRKIPQPVAAKIYTNIKRINTLDVFLANNTVLLTIKENRLTIPVNKLQIDFLTLTANDRIRPGYFPLYGELSAKNDTVGLNKLSVIFDSLKKDDIKKSFVYARANRQSLLQFFAFIRYTSFFADYAKVEKDFSLLPEWAKNTPDGKNILAKIEGAKSVQLNTRAKDFIQATSSGQKISLKNFEGKYVLLDFWASWCAPCRKQHPALISLFEEFGDKKFEIISISLDDDRKAWLEAIARDKINKWTNISDLKGQQNDIALKYGVQSIPANFLIDPTGMIIDKNLEPEQLYKKLKALTGN